MIFDKVHCHCALLLFNDLGSLKSLSHFELIKEKIPEAFSNIDFGH